MFSLLNLQSLLGLVVIVAVCWAISENRRAFPWRLTLGAIAVQADIARRFGWHPSTAHRSHQAGLLPPPDGNEDTGAWWWEHTIRTFARDVLVHRCIECGTWLASAQGAATHRTRLHGRRVH